ncbi:Hypothetical predicted protein [Pelobates cultripes]|uniref:Uncharacterized protein n=1 Tax=Pelobates cultripes TaxID=61616 RepID=A0AAD1W154_PELCU|nr:Hypothetical predicted protein [Pelobates cultripes]
MATSRGHSAFNQVCAQFWTKLQNLRIISTPLEQAVVQKRRHAHQYGFHRHVQHASGKGLRRERHVKSLQGSALPHHLGPYHGNNSTRPLQILPLHPWHGPPAPKLYYLMHWVHKTEKRQEQYVDGAMGKAAPNYHLGPGEKTPLGTDVGAGSRNSPP